MNNSKDGVEFGTGKELDLWTLNTNKKLNHLEHGKD